MAVMKGNDTEIFFRNGLSYLKRREGFYKRMPDRYHVPRKRFNSRLVLKSKHLSLETVELRFHPMVRVLKFRQIAPRVLKVSGSAFASEFMVRALFYRKSWSFLKN